MPLIDRTYFDGPIILAGVNEASTRAAIDAAIAEYEEEYLQAVLGASLYAAFKAGLLSGTRSYFSEQFSDQFQKAGIDERWEWIRDGHTFTAYGRTYIWPGLINSELRSPVANYVYWQYRASNATNTVSTGGEVKAKHANAEGVSVDTKMVRAWNKMVDWNRVLGAMISGLTVYPEFERPRCAIDVYEYQNTFNI